MIKNLAIDLHTSKQRLSEIIRFYNCSPIVRTLSGQLGWSHYLALIEVDNEKKERLIYYQKMGKTLEYKAEIKIEEAKLINSMQKRFEKEAKERWPENPSCDAAIAYIKSQKVWLEDELKKIEMRISE